MPPSFCICLQLIGEVFEVERPLLHFLGDLRRFFDVDRLRGFLDEGDERRPCRVCARRCAEDEILERVPFLADTDQFDRLASYGAHRECGAATAIAVSAGQYDAGDTDVAVEGFRGVDGVLACQRVGNEENLVGVDRGFDVADFVHQLFVDG